MAIQIHTSLKNGIISSNTSTNHFIDEVIETIPLSEINFTNQYNSFAKIIIEFIDDAGVVESTETFTRT